MVLYCDRKAYVSFNQPIGDGLCVLVRVCKEHADELKRRHKEMIRDSS
jgi:hypothetical protein